MPVPILSGPPDQVEAGNYVAFTDSFTDFPVTGWTMEFVLRGPDGASQSIAATISSSLFQVALPTNLAPGVYEYAEYVTETATSQRTTARTGTLEVLPDLTQAAVLSTAAITLALIEAAIQRLSGSDNISVSFNGQSFTKRDLKNLTDQRTYWKAEVLREQARADGARQCPRVDTGRGGISFARTSSWLPWSFWR